MRFKISFPLVAFASISEAYLFADKFSLFPKEGVPWFDTKPRFFAYEEDIPNLLEKHRRNKFTLAEHNSSGIDFGKTVTYRKLEEKNLHLFIFENEDENDINLSDLLIEAHVRSFSFAYLHDFNKSKWQNEAMISNYRTYNKPFDHLPKIWDPVLSPVLRSEIIDVSLNPGHEKETYDMCLSASSDIWFGPQSWLYFDKKTIKKFSRALEIDEPIDDVVYVKLFDKHAPSYEVPEILDIQKEFRQWSKMDDIERLLDSKVVKSTLTNSLTVDLTGKKNEKNDSSNLS